MLSDPIISIQLSISSTALSSLDPSLKFSGLISNLVRDHSASPASEHYDFLEFLKLQSKYNRDVLSIFVDHMITMMTSITNSRIKMNPNLNVSALERILQSPW